MSQTISRRQAISLLTSAGALVTSCTNNKPEPQVSPYRFAVASDGHFGEPGTDYVRYYEDLLASLSREHAEEPLDFTVINGDLVHGTRPDLLPEVKNYLEKLPMPYFVTRGNHDRVSLQEWKSLWGYPTNHLVKLPSAALVLLDTSDSSGAYFCGNEEWLRTAIASVDPSTPIFIFMHIPFIRSLTGSNNCDSIIAVINSFPNVKAIFHGHDHSLDMGVSIAGKHVFFDGRLGSSWGVSYRGYRMVEYSLNNQYKSWQFNLETTTIMNETIF